jgi:hypothetical protein
VLGLNALAVGKRKTHGQREHIQGGLHVLHIQRAYASGPAP